MTKRKTRKTAEIRDLSAAEALRQGWLAYLGVYGLAYERAKPAIEKLTKNYAGIFSDLVEKGVEIEATAKEQIVDARERAEGLYGAGIEKVRSVLPIRAANGRVKELEAEVASLTKKLAAQAKAPAARKAKIVKAAA